MHQPMVSLVSSVYNADSCLKVFFENICSQTIFDDMEVIVVLNDPSPMALDISEYYRKHYPTRFRIISVSRETIGASINRGYREAHGKYLAYADVDDAREPYCYESQTATLENAPKYDFTYGDFVIVNALGKCQGQLVKTPEFNRIEFTHSSYVGANHFFRRELLERCGYWDEQFRSGGDFEYQIRAAHNCSFIKTAGPPLFYYTKSLIAGSASSTVYQPIERTAIEMRYGNYDKTELLKGYPYVRRARRYRLDQLMINGEWQYINRYVPNYRQMMKQREADRRAFETKYRLWVTRYHATLPLRAINRGARSGIRWFLKQFGLLEGVKNLLSKR